MRGDRPNPYLRNLNSKIASLPMILIVLFVFVGGTMWTVASSFTNIKTLPIFTPQEFYDNFVGMAQYTRLWRTPRWTRISPACAVTVAAVLPDR